MRACGAAGFRLRAHRFPPDVQRMDRVAAERRAHLTQQIRLKKIQEAATAAPVEDAFAADDETVAFVAGDKWRPVNARMSVGPDGGQSARANCPLGMRQRRGLSCDRRVWRAHGVSAVAMLGALSTSAVTWLVSRRHP